ncbi:transposase [Pseudoalteromonas sp. Of11M-6]|uniref:transposase n=1 Tax=Pseudoalteromonas sp. Of11M-6 TaxID=2917754 RepID=UPI001EF4F2BF|nr:transposase [Pseudoalteromonas sp. Of11M-6]MCG7556165.1 transposase [Pseudoalteromonas sp. Of11M-6]
MATARCRQICLSETKYYHCISRCVRQAYLCGQDIATGRSYEHRRDWVEEKLLALKKTFCIDVCAYAVMNNHTHIVLHVDIQKAKRLTDKAIIIRWHKQFKGNWLTHKFIRNEPLSDAERSILDNTINIYRSRITCISWFMRTLNEYIARRANREDQCTGRFWEGRFKSQALLDEAALAACMAYVDLNPIRANLAKLPEESKYTSVKKRIELAKQGKQPRSLFRFAGNPRKHMPKGIPLELSSYLELVELTGRCIRSDKIGCIINKQPILDRLNLTSKNWINLTTQFSTVIHGAAGSSAAKQKYCDSLSIQRRSNISNCLALFG